MTTYTIEESTLTGIADALRGKVGETETVSVLSKVSKTDNFSDFGTFEGSPIVKSFYDVVTLEGASSIKVKMSVQTFGGIPTHGEEGKGAQRVEIASGEHSVMPEDSLAFGGEGVMKIEELLFENTDTITFYFFGSNSDILNGYYAECYGLDAEGNLVVGEGFMTTDVTRLFKPIEMADAIDSIKAASPDCNNRHIPDEGLVIKGNAFYYDNNGRLGWLINECGTEMRTEGITNCTNMFANDTSLEEIPFDINCSKSCNNLSSMFNGCKNLKALPTIIYSEKPSIPTSKYNFMDVADIVSGCNSLREIPEDYFASIVPEGYWEAKEGLKANGEKAFYASCYSLRKVPSYYKHLMNWEASAYYYSMYASMFIYCYSLDEVVGLPVENVAYTSNAMGSCFIHCNRLKRFTFETNEDGSPKQIAWSKQLLDLSSYVGYTPTASSITSYNSGITEATRIIDDATYEQFKNHEDSWTALPEYSRYDRLSAIETINSLPDCSSGSGNVIKFKGDAGSATDGGAISTLTEAEIAIATAKGFTVTLV